MTTIKQIAALAGVSRGTVDRVLNNRGSVNPETEKKVLRIATALNYKPNRAGCTLAAQKKKLKIGVILFGEENPFFEEVMEGVHAKAEELSEYGCTILSRQVSFDPAAQCAAIDALLSEDIHGLVISPFNSSEIAEKITHVVQSGVPVVTTNTDIENSCRMAYVGSNFYESGRTAGGLMGLITGGSARLGIITGFSNVLCHTERIAGFRDCVKTSYPDIQVVGLSENHDDEFESYRVTSQLLSCHPEINALYFTAGGVCGGCKAVLDAGRTDIRIITFDTVSTTRELIHKGVISATISQQPFVQGALPVNILFDYLTTGTAPENEINYVEAAIKIRENL